jgi:hypothetical protein
MDWMEILEDFIKGTKREIDLYNDYGIKGLSKN